MASSSSQQTPSNTGLLGTTRQKDPFWMAQLSVVKNTSAWRQYYKQACIAGGFPQASDHLFLSSSFKPWSPNESSAAYESVVAQQASDEDSSVMVFTLSYDHDRQGKLSQETWNKVLVVLRQIVEPSVSVQLWVDKIDSYNRKKTEFKKWGIRQLLPYVMFPVIRIDSRPDPGFWSNMEGLAGIFGRGLYHDKSLDSLVIQSYSPVEGKDFFISRAATWNAGDAIATFYIHLMYGCLSKYRNHHKEALEALRRGGLFINLLLADPDNFLELWLGHERKSLFGNGKFEIQNGFWCRTDVPGWHGLKEWITLDRYCHPIPDSGRRFRIKGFVNVYSGENKTMAIVHWELLSSGWTRRLLVELSHGSREHGKALTHLRMPGYNQTEKDEVLEWERMQFTRSDMPQLYSFDSHNIRWE